MSRSVATAVAAVLAASMLSACGAADSPSNANTSPSGGQVVGTAPPSADPAVTDVPIGDGPVDPSIDATPEPELPDGRHPGFLKALSVQRLTFDLVVWLTGQAAKDAWLTDHPGETDGPPNDYYIVNNNTRRRVLYLADNVPVIVARGGSPTETEQITVSQLLNPPYIDDLQDRMVWLTVSGGLVTKIEEQWVP
jgi:hypothetical protein